MSLASFDAPWPTAHKGSPGLVNRGFSSLQNRWQQQRRTRPPLCEGQTKKTRTGTRIVSIPSTCVYMQHCLRSPLAAPCIKQHCSTGRAMTVSQVTLIAAAAEYSPFFGIEKGAVLQEARIFNESHINARQCQQVISRIEVISVGCLAIHQHIQFIPFRQLHCSTFLHCRSSQSCCIFYVRERRSARYLTACAFPT